MNGGEVWDKIRYNDYTVKTNIALGRTVELTKEKPFDAVHSNLGICIQTPVQFI